MRALWKLHLIPNRQVVRFLSSTQSWLGRVEIIQKGQSRRFYSSTWKCETVQVPKFGAIHHPIQTGGVEISELKDMVTSHSSVTTYYFPSHFSSRNFPGESKRTAKTGPVSLSRTPIHPAIHPLFASRLGWLLLQLLWGKLKLKVWEKSCCPFPSC